MQRLSFKDIKDLVSNISKKCNELNINSEISIISKYKKTKEIITELIRLGYPICSIGLEQPIYNNYYDEYIISLCRDGIFCEPMKRENKYLDDKSTIVYVSDDCNSKVLFHLHTSIMYEFYIEAEEDNYSENHDIEDKTHGFSINYTNEDKYYSYSFYSTDKKLVSKMAELLSK